MSLSRKHKQMLTAAAYEPAPVGECVAAWLRQWRPSDTAKHAAVAFDVAVVTAKGWLAGRRPSNEHLDRMIARFGRPFVAFVYQPICPDLAEDALAAEFAELSGRLADLKAKIEDLKR